MATVTEVMVSTESNKLALLLLCWLFPALGTAGDWKFTPGIKLSERYTDNVNLAGSGAEQSEWLTEINPHFSIHRNGARLKVDVDYSLQGVIYADGTSSNKLRNSLNGRASAELAEDWFFLDASARVSHVQNSLANGVGLGDSVGITNTTSVGAFSLSPYLKHRFGSFATVEARVSQDGVFIGNSGVSDTASTRYSLSANSGIQWHPLSWNAAYSKSDNNNSSTTDTSSERATLNARYQLHKKYGLLAQASVEKNDYTGVTAGVRDYSYYGVGAFYTPSRYFSMDVLYNHSDNGNFLSGSVTLNPTLRTKIDATAGQRAYGRSYSLGFTHRTRKSNWSLRYQDELTTSQRQFQEYIGSLLYYDCTTTGPELYQPGVPPSDPDNCSLKVAHLVDSTLVDHTYLSKNLVGSVNYTQRRNTWTLSVYKNRREFLSGAAIGTSDDVTGAQASWSLRTSPLTTFTLTAGMSQAEESVTGRSDELWNVALVATRKFQPKLSGSVEVRHQERESNLAGGDYTENSVAAHIKMNF